MYIIVFLTDCFVYICVYIYINIFVLFAAPTLIIVPVLFLP